LALKDLITQVIDWTATAAFAYLLVAAILVMVVNGYTTRISLDGFLIPHASKVALWSGTALLVLRPRFGWKFPASVLLLYCMAELITNWIYVPVHFITDPTYLANWEKLFSLQQNYYFVFSNIFFVLGIILAHISLRGRYSFKIWDWSLLPFAVFIGLWVAQGYVTDSTLFFATPYTEFQEFTWNVLYLLVMFSIFRAKGNEDWKLPLFRS
jgi:hypothetical protein